jgi:uncharacterized protein
MSPTRRRIHSVSLDADRGSPAIWVHLLQALVAREAVEQFGVSARRAAELLGLTPSAVSQYLSGRRLGRWFGPYATDERARAIARTAAQELLRPHPGPPRRPRVLLEGAAALAELGGAIPRAPESGPERPSAAASARVRGIARWLRQRIRTEQTSVAQSMRLARKARDELTRAVLRQIASDSLRHAEIMASLVPYVDRGLLSAYVSGLSRQDVRALIEAERRAEVPATADSARHLRGTMAILVTSMEADEKKHTELLRALLASGFEAEIPPPSLPGARGAAGASATDPG